MKGDLVVFNNATPVKPYTLDVIMGYNLDGNQVYYRLKKNHSNYEFRPSNTCALPRYVLDEDDECVRFLKKIFGDMFTTIPEYGTKEDLEGYINDMPSPLDIETKCNQIDQEYPDLAKEDTMYRNIKEAAKKGCRFCFISKDYINQLSDICEIEERDPYNLHRVSLKTVGGGANGHK